MIARNHTVPIRRRGSSRRRTFAAGVMALAAIVSSAAWADSITLTWTAPGDDGNVGRATSYELRYSTSPVAGTDTLGWWQQATTLGVLPPPLTAGSREQFTVAGLVTGTRYYFVLRTSDEVPNVSAFSNVRARDAGAPGESLATPSDFTAQAVEGGVDLAWSEPASGAGAGYRIYRRSGTSPDTLLASLGVATTRYQDGSALGGTAYEYRLVTWQDTREGPPAVASISVPTDRLATASTAVRGYPNPARDHVSIRFHVAPSTGSTGRVRVVIYDLTGRRISQLFDGEMPEGEQSLAWACRSDKGSAVAPGIYNVILDGPSGRSVTQLAIVP